MVISILEAIKECSQVSQIRNKLNPRLHKISVGKIIGILILISYFTFLPSMIKMIWPYSLQNYSKYTIYVIGMLIISVGVNLIYNCIYYVIYHLKHPFFQQYKNTELPWPWQQDPQAWRRLLRKSIKLAAFNIVVINGLSLLLSFKISQGFQYSLEKWPTVFERVWQIGVFVFFEDIVSFFAHKALHTPLLYRFHKIHHEYNKYVVSISLFYQHPIDYILVGPLPFVIGYQILHHFTDVHVTTIFIWLIYRIIQGLDGHSGYTFPWNTLNLFPNTLGPAYHQFHHTANDGNFGVMILFLDAWFKKQDSYIKFLKNALKQKQIKQNITINPT